VVNKDDYLIELPNLKINKKDIDKFLKMVDDLSEYWIEFQDDDKNQNFNWGCWLKYESMLEYPLVKEWVNKLPFGLKISNSSVMKSKPWFILDPHKDKRNASFMIVLTPNPSPVYFLSDDGKLILEHTYTCPTVINTHVMHGVNNFSDFDRITFQIGITQPWEEIVQILKSSYLA
jgi:hypothetical protein